jgi:outer membrane protein assembly factor BamE (lipoprotein component of BamABCDE complex)
MRGNKNLKGIYIILTATLILLFVSGCGVLIPIQYGDEKIVSQSTVEKIKSDESTMNDVRSLMGPPRSVSKSRNGETKWLYQYGTIWMATHKFKVLIITFKDDGVVKEVDIHEPASERDSPMQGISGGNVPQQMTHPEDPRGGQGKTGP